MRTAPVEPEPQFEQRLWNRFAPQPLKVRRDAAAIGAEADAVIRQLRATQASPAAEPVLREAPVEVVLNAARYCWLRERPSLIGWDWWPHKVPHYVNVSPEFMDGAIDAEMTGAALAREPVALIETAGSSLADPITPSLPPSSGGSSSGLA